MSKNIEASSVEARLSALERTVNQLKLSKFTNTVSKVLCKDPLNCIKRTAALNQAPNWITQPPEEIAQNLNEQLSHLLPPLSILSSVSADTEINPTVALSWLRDAVLLSLKQYNVYFASISKELSQLSRNLSEKVSEKAVKYVLQKTSLLESALSKLKHQQALLGERVRNNRLEEKFMQYVKDKEIQEERFNQTIRAETNIAKCAQEIKSFFEEHSNQRKHRFMPRHVQGKSLGNSITLPPTISHNKRPEKLGHTSGTYITSLEETESPPSERPFNVVLPKDVSVSYKKSHTSNTRKTGAKKVGRSDVSRMYTAVKVVTQDQGVDAEEILGENALVRVYDRNKQKGSNDNVSIGNNNKSDA